MNYCPGAGTSEIIPSITNAAVAFVGGALATALLDVIPPPFNVVAAGYMGTVTFELAEFCLTDPPAMPTTTDIANAAIGLLGSPTARQAGIATLEQFIGANVWSTYCQCVTGPQPTPPSPPAPPADLPVAPVPATTGSPCQIAAQVAIHDAAGSESTYHAQTFIYLPNTATSVSFNLYITDNLGSGAHTQFFVAFYLPDGTTVITSATYNCFTPTGSATNQVISATGVGSTGAIQTSVNIQANGLSTGMAVLTLQVPSGATIFQVFLRNAGTASAGLSGAALVAVFCGSATLGSTGCCPPDPSLTAALAAIQNLLTELISSQPVLGVRSYASGAVHAALSGYGNLTFTDAAIGVKVTLTSLGSGIGSVIGDPVFYYDVGWISLVTEQGNLQGTRVEYDGQFIPFPTLVSSLDYSFNPTVVASITEVTAGP